VLDFAGVDPSGASDSTAGIQSALVFTRLQGGESRKLYWPRGTYRVIGTLTVGTNQAVEFDPGVTVNFIAADPLNTPLFTIAGQSEVYFEGNGAEIVGTRGTVAGQGVGDCFFVYGSDNVTIRNFVIRDFATDGIEITGDNTGSGPCRNVLVENCTVDNCRRNAMSIISVIGCTVIGGTYSNTNGSLGGPWAGIDVEPNQDCFLQNVVIIGATTSSNAGSGLLMVPGQLSIVGAASTLFDVTVIGGKSINDGSSTAVNEAGLMFSNGGALVNKIHGQVNVRDFVVESPKGRGVSWYNWSHDKAPRVLLDGVAVYNPDYQSSASTNVNRSGFVLYCDSTQAEATMGSIELRNCVAEDRRVSPRMVWGAVIAADASKSVRNITVTDHVSTNYTATDKYPVNTDFANTASGGQNVVVSYTNPRPVSLAGSTASPGWGGQRLRITVAGSTFTLPLAANCPGLYYEIEHGASSGGVSVVRSGSDTIKYPGVAAATSVSLSIGDVVRIRSSGSTTWVAAPVA
jgi:hypothetical protein